MSNFFSYVYDIIKKYWDNSFSKFNKMNIPILFAGFKYLKRVDSTLPPKKDCRPKKFAVTADK